MRKIIYSLILVCFAFSAFADKPMFQGFLKHSPNKVTLTSNEKAKVYINGRYFGETNLTTMLPKGNYKLLLIPNNDSFNTLETSFNVTGNETFNFNLEPKFFNVQINCDQAADVFINNELKGKSNLVLKLQKGKYEIKLQGKGQIPTAGFMKKQI